jgi:hypothetical protein
MSGLSAIDRFEAHVERAGEHHLWSGSPDSASVVEGTWRNVPDGGFAAAPAGADFRRRERIGPPPCHCPDLRSATAPTRMNREQFFAKLATSTRNT